MIIRRYTFVWDEVIRLYGLLGEHEGWHDKQTVDVKSITDHTTTVRNCCILFSFQLLTYLH
jgi:hypothetical protein